jgi:hypothetical protein
MRLYCLRCVPRSRFSRLKVVAHLLGFGIGLGGDGGFGAGAPMVDLVVPKCAWLSFLLMLRTPVNAVVDRI